MPRRDDRPIEPDTPLARSATPRRPVHAGATLLRTLLAATLVVALSACGGQGDGDPSGAPAAPDEVTVESGPGSITVSWTHDGARVESFDVVREEVAAAGLRGVALETIATVPADQRTYLDEAVEPGSSYRYGVVARGSDGSGSPSTEQTGDAVTPQPPLDISFSLAWEASAAKGDLRSLAFAPDGGHVAIGEVNTDVQIVDLDTETVEAVLDTSSTISSLAYSPDGSVIAAGGERLWMFDATSGDVLWEGHFGDDPDASREWFESVAFSPDGARLAAAGDEGSLRVWTVATGASELTVDVNTDASALTGAATVSKADLERERRIAEGAPDAPTLAPSQTVVRLAAVAFSPDGTVLATGGSDGGVRTWNASTGASVRSYEEFGYSVNDLLFTPDGARLVATGGGGTSGTVAWNVSDGSVAQRFDGDSVRALAMPSSGDVLIGGAASGEIVLWNTDTGARRLAFTAHDPRLGGLAVSPDGATIVSAGGYRDGTVASWSISDGSEQGRLQIPGHLANVVLAGQGARFVTVSDAGEVIGWDADNGSVLFEAFTSTYTFGEAVAVSPDGSRVAIGIDGGFDLFDSANGDLLLTAEPLDGFARVASLAYSPDGTTLALGSESELHLVDATNGTLMNSVTTSDDFATLTAVAYAPDGDTLVSGEGYRPGTAAMSVWDADTLAPIATRDAHDGTLAALAFDASGERLISAGRDPSRVWATDDWSVEADIVHFGTASAAAFTGDGSGIVLAGWGMTELQVLDTTSLDVVGRLPAKTMRFAFDPDADRVAVMNEGTVQVWTMSGP